MRRDTSLSDFVDGGSTDGTDDEDTAQATVDDDDTTGDDTECVAEDDAETAVRDGPTDDERSPPDPVVSTSRFAVDSASCSACGSTAERTWQDGDTLVCADCKDW